MTKPRGIGPFADGHQGTAGKFAQPSFQVCGHHALKGSGFLMFSH